MVSPCSVSSLPISWLGWVAPDFFEANERESHTHTRATACGMDGGDRRPRALALGGRGRGSTFSCVSGNSREIWDPIPGGPMTRLLSGHSQGMTLVAAWLVGRLTFSRHHPAALTWALVFPLGSKAMCPPMNIVPYHINRRNPTGYS